MYIDGTIDERGEKKEREKEERNGWTVDPYRSPSFLLKWTTEKWAVDDDDQATLEKNGSAFVSPRIHSTINRKGTKKERVISFTK
jgi:hypothetical protein